MDASLAKLSSLIVKRSSTIVTFKMETRGEVMLLCTEQLDNTIVGTESPQSFLRMAHLETRIIFRHLLCVGVSSTRETKIKFMQN